jgi:hypothetical protein
MPPRPLLLSLLAVSLVFLLVGAAPASPPPKLLGGDDGSKAAVNPKPLLPSSGKPTPASLALQRLQNLAVNALRWVGRILSSTHSRRPDRVTESGL